MNVAAGEWIITAEERAKHDAQFMQLNPANGFITGDAARGFFLKSGLPPMVLGQIWELSDMNKDGRLDPREFSIAMYLIKAKLQSRDLPSVLPESLKRDPMAANGNPNQFPPVVSSSPAYGTLPMRPPTSFATAFDGLGVVSGSTFSNTLPRAQVPVAYAPVPSQAPLTSTYAALPLRPAVPTPSYGTVQTSSVASPVVTSLPYGAAGVPVGGGMQPAQWAKYAQLLTTYDVQRKGFLTGAEARQVLMQSGLQTNLLAQIWNLSDADCDGNLSLNEFCVAMYLTEMARTGQTLPTQLPPAMFMTPVGQSNAPVLSQNNGQNIPISNSQQNMLDAAALKAAADEAAEKVSFEDKRQENFKKGEAELERRRKMLEDQMKAEEEARMAAERAEAEKREQQRLEAERKRQEEMQRQLERQQQLERERQEQRNKAIEQREAARLQLERQRQAEWDRQRREQLTQEKQREKNQLELRRSRITDLKFESNSIESKQQEFSEKVARLKENIAMVTAAIDAMKQTRDLKIQGIEGMKSQYMEVNGEYAKVHAEREQLRMRYQQMTLSDPIADEMNQLRQQLAQRQAALDRLRGDLDQLADGSAARQQALSDARGRLENIQENVKAVEANNESARQAVSERRARYRSKKSTSSVSKQQSLHNGWEESGAGLPASFTTNGNDPFQQPTSNPADKWDAFFPTPNGSGSKETNGTNGHDGWATSNGNGFDAAFGSHSATKATAQPSSASSFSFATGSSTPHTKSAARYKVIYTFSARNEDELDLHEGDIINVPADQSTAEPGWVYGEIDGRHGMVPENYIQRLAEPEQDAFSPSVLPAAAQPPNSSEFSTPFLSQKPAAPAVNQNDLCVALYNYESPESGDLNFNQGDIIHVLTRDGEWWTGQLNGRQGMFPATFVKPLDAESDSAPPSFSPPTLATNSDAQASFGEDAEVGAVMSPAAANTASMQPTKPASLLPQSSPSAGLGTATERLRAELETKLAASNQAPPKSGKQNGSKKPEIVTVIAEYRATGAEQLTLEPGNLIYIKKKSDSGWWQGELHARGKARQVGWFPANYVRPWTGGPGGSRQSSRTTPVSDIEADREKVVTMYPYAASHDDELTFKKDEIISVLNKDDPDWWRGELNGVVGVFPSNYVKPIIQASLQPKPSEFDVAAGGVGEFVEDNAGNYHWSQDVGMIPGTEIEPAYHEAPVESPSPGDWGDETGGDRLERKRQQAMEEFVKTEEDYVQDLHTALEVFAKPLVAGGGLTPELSQKIFVNWEELIACNVALLKSLRVRRQMVGDNLPMESIADLISAAMPHFTPYIRYCATHHKAVAALQRASESDKKFKPIHQACMRDSRSGGLPLSSFLLKPVQRVTKYHLLVKKILDHTPEDFPDWDELCEAHAKAVQLCEQVNQGVEQRENSERLEWLQNHVDTTVPGLCEKLTFNSLTNCVGPRRLLFYGGLARTKSPSKLVWCFLFNDTFLVGKVVKGSLIDSLLFSDDPKVADVKLKVDKQPHLLDSISAKAVEAPAGSSSTESLTDFVLSLKDSNSVVRTLYEFRCRTQVERNNWVKNINEAVGQYLPKQHQSRVKRSMSLYKTNAVGRLRLNVVGAKELPFARPPKGKPDAFCLLTLGEQEVRTRVVNANCNPEWNEPAQFMLKNADADVLCITVYDRDLFSPNSFLGGTEIRIKDLVQEIETMNRSTNKERFFKFRAARSSQQPLVKRLQLLQAPGQKGVVILKLDVQMFTAHQSPSKLDQLTASSTMLSSIDDSMFESASSSQTDLDARGQGRVKSAIATRRISAIQTEDALRRKALSTVALDQWDD